MSRKRKTTSGVAVRGDGGVAGEGRVGLVKGEMVVYKSFIHGISVPCH